MAVLKQATEIIERFGGIRPMATKMGVPVTTVQGWKKRDVIPANRRGEILEAARTHDVDLSGLIASSGSTNDNAAPSVSAPQKTDPLARSSFREEVAVAPATPPQQSAGNEALLTELRRSQKNEVQRNLWFMVGLIVALVALALILLWPAHKDLSRQVNQNGEKLSGLESDVGQVKKQQSLLSAMIPDNIEARMGELQQKAEEIQTTVQAFSSQAEALSETVMSPDAGNLSERLTALEEQITAITGPSDMTELLAKVNGLQQSVQGQEQLSATVESLNALVQAMQGRMDKYEETLAAAREEDPALGQTFEGVSSEDLKAATLLLGFTQFRSALNRNEPFADDLELLQGLIGDSHPELQAALTKLAPKAESGVLTSEGLSKELKGLAGDIVVSSLKGEEVAVGEKAKARLNDVLQVKKDGELLTGTETQATVARAQALLDQGDVKTAIAELQSLEGDAAQTAQPIIDEAQATLLAQQVQEMLTGSILSRIDQPRSGNTLGADVINEVKKVTGGRKMIRDENSDLSILPQ